jgi:hypothetical protein
MRRGRELKELSPNEYARRLTVTHHLNYYSLAKELSFCYFSSANFHNFSKSILLNYTDIPTR